jgi:hypothetical protein
MTEQPKAGHMAIVCGDMGSFGMLRKFGIGLLMRQDRPNGARA